MAPSKVSPHIEDNSFKYIDLVSTNGSLSPLFAGSDTQDIPQAQAGAQPASLGPNLSTRSGPEPGQANDPNNVPDLRLRQPSGPTAPETAPACVHLLSHIGGWVTLTNGPITTSQWRQLLAELPK
ncbi:hypothetical protein TWF506_001553 [Arthrobotrys conoides]|uniref:Uncharacterized protein n=1 Tax=Arthrobotrys conoides TaxID=74498 RepID=A0AAN8NTB8_9PEZI